MKYKTNKTSFCLTPRFFLQLCLMIFVVYICTVSLSGTNSDGTDTKKDDDSKISIDLLKVPSSPAYVLLGNETSSIPSPLTGTDLVVTILNQTENLTTIPKNFAIDFLPYWVFFGKKITYESYEDNKLLDNLLQSLSISIATKSNTNSESKENTNLESNPEPRSVSLGIRFSLLRGDVSEEYEGQIEAIKGILENNFHDDLKEFITEKIKDDPELKKLNERFLNAPNKDEIQDEIEDKKTKRIEEIKLPYLRSFLKEKHDEIQVLKKAISNLEFKREGLKIDLAGGFVMDFPGNTFDEGEVNRWGLWMTIGYEGKALKNWSTLGVLRYLSNDSEGLKNHSFDIGGRIIYDINKKFLLSGEALYRKYNEHEVDTNQWRAVLLLEYALAKNKALVFTFGRDFEGNENGNLISMLSLKLGFGSKRPLF